MWVMTVASEMHNARPISALARPWPTRRSTSISRADKLGWAGEATAGSTPILPRPPAGDRPTDQPPTVREVERGDGGQRAHGQPPPGGRAGRDRRDGQRDREDGREVDVPEPTDALAGTLQARPLTSCHAVHLPRRGHPLRCPAGWPRRPQGPKVRLIRDLRCPVGRSACRWSVRSAGPWLRFAGPTRRSARRGRSRGSGSRRCPGRGPDQVRRGRARTRPGA